MAAALVAIDASWGTEHGSIFARVGGDSPLGEQLRMLPTKLLVPLCPPLRQHRPTRQFC